MTKSVKMMFANESPCCAVSRCVELHVIFVNMTTYTIPSASSNLTESLLAVLCVQPYVVLKKHVIGPYLQLLG